MTFIIDRFPVLHNCHDACDAVLRPVVLHRMAGNLFRKPVGKSLWLTLTSNGISKTKPTRRSRRGGTKLRRRITTVSVSRSVWGLPQGSNKLRANVNNATSRCGANMSNLQQVTLTKHDASLACKPAIVALLNVRSIRNKGEFIADYVTRCVFNPIWIHFSPPSSIGLARRRSWHYVEIVVPCCYG